jgi:hypothetical protein
MTIAPTLNGSRQECLRASISDSWALTLVARAIIATGFARIGLAIVLVAAGATHGSAQSCPPPSKFAAGTCVQSCPGGYEDTGRTCVYRRQGGGGS